MADVILPFKITTLLFIRDTRERFLLLRRRKAPNLNKWSPPGGKLEMGKGESPFECALREAREEVDMNLVASDLHLWGMVSEKHFEGSGHWLMFLFVVHPRLEPDALPERIDEGHFAFFDRGAIDTLEVPETDRVLLWPYFDQYENRFIAYRVDCEPGGELEITIEETL